MTVVPHGRQESNLLFTDFGGRSPIRWLTHKKRPLGYPPGGLWTEHDLYPEHSQRMPRRLPGSDRHSHEAVSVELIMMDILSRSVLLQ
jgi:hypothetical protein